MVRKFIRLTYGDPEESQLDESKVTTTMEAEFFLSPYPKFPIHTCASYDGFGKRDTLKSSVHFPPSYHQQVNSVLQFLVRLSFGIYDHSALVILERHGLCN